MRQRIFRIAAAAALAAWATTARAAGDPVEGERLYKIYCTQCHGVQGNGKGINAVTMEVQPRDHTDAKEMGARTDADLFKAIKQGGPAVNKSVLMPSWDATLSDGQIDHVIAYLRVLSGTKGH